MDKVREFHRRARECMLLAEKASTPDIRGHFENLARTWEKLADERKTFFVEEMEKEADLSLGAGAVK